MELHRNLKWGESGLELLGFSVLGAWLISGRQENQTASQKFDISWLWELEGGGRDILIRRGIPGVGVVALTEVPGTLQPLPLTWALQSLSDVMPFPQSFHPQVPCDPDLRCSTESGMLKHTDGLASIWFCSLLAWDLGERLTSMPQLYYLQSGHNDSPCFKRQFMLVNTGKTQNHWHMERIQYLLLLLSTVAQSPSHVWLFVTPWTAICQACLSFTISSLLKLMSIESVMPSNYVILLSSIFQHQKGLFQWVGSSHQVAKVLELQHQSFQWIFKVNFL